MKVGFVLDDTLDSPDGVQQYVLTIGQWLSSQGHEVHYLVGETKRTDIPHMYSLSRNIKVRFNGNHMSMPLPAGKLGLVKLLARERYDILHVQVPYSPLLAGRIIGAAPARTAVVGTFHIAPHSRMVRYATSLLALASRRSLARFDKLLSVSSAAQSFAKITYGMDSDVLPNVVVTRPFHDAEPYPLEGEGPVILFLGRLVPRKGCMVLLQAINQLRTLDPTIRLRVVICGRGPLEPELYKYAAQHNIADIVRFAGFVSEADKPRYLKAADLAVFPSSGGESFGIVLIEAMAADHPVVFGAANPGYAAVLGSNPNSLFPVGDPMALAGAIKKFLNDPSARQAALDWQRSTITQYEVDVVGRQLLTVYERAIWHRVPKK
jgi:phosphatidylinositol alpha-mannosyltransferase